MRVFQGTTNSAVFEDYIEQLLQHCGRWPEPNSVLVMDNASFHHTERIAQMCADAGVKLMYLPPYLPDLNLIKEFFAKLKAFIKRSWSTYEEGSAQGLTLMKGTRFGIMLCCIGRRVRASTRLTEAAKALATRDHVRDISGPLALSNKSQRQH